MTLPAKHALLAITTSRIHGPIAFLTPPGVIDDVEKTVVTPDDVKLLILQLQAARGGGVGGGGGG